MKNFIILFVMLLSFGAVNTFAQCPPDSLPGPSPYMGSWVNEGCVIIKIPKTSNPSDSCSYSVCYCWRAGGLAAPFVEIYIYGYSVIPPLYCNPFSEGDNYTSIIFKRLVRQNPKNNDWPCPPCSLGVGAPNTRLTVSGCKDDVNPNISCGTCCYYCTTDYAVCCDDDGNKVITYISQSTVGTTSCPAGCHIGPCDAP